MLHLSQLPFSFTCFPNPPYFVSLFLRKAQPHRRAALRTEHSLKVSQKMLISLSGTKTRTTVATELYQYRNKRVPPTGAEEVAE